MKNLVIKVGAIMTGLARNKVDLVPYNYEWSKLYKKEIKLLKSIIGEYVVDIQHVGSTSIEGLDAKPIIDIAIGVQKLDCLDDIRPHLESVGYHFRENAGVEKRLFFAKGNVESRTHYLHIVKKNSTIWNNYILFRDFIRSNDLYRNKYRQLKQSLAKQFKDDRAAYTQSKNQFIKDVISLAQQS